MNKKYFSLKGYSLPLTPEGRSSLVEPPPWHYGGEMLQVIFKTGDDFIRYLPPPFEMSSNPGLAFVWFTEIVSVSDSNIDQTSTNPERTQYKECLIGVHCKINGVESFFVPYV